MTNKKGSLELSVNAIVILIIALAILGLVIGFAVTRFRDVSSQLRITEETPEPTPAQPITLPGGKNTLKLSKKTEALMEIKIYNPSADTLDTGGDATVDCETIPDKDNDGVITSGECVGSPNARKGEDEYKAADALGCLIANITNVAPCDGGTSNDNWFTATKQASTMKCIDVTTTELNSLTCETVGCGTVDAGTGKCTPGNNLLTCSPSGFVYEFSSAVSNVAPGQTASVPVILAVDGSSVPGKYACNLRFSDSVSRTIFLEVE